MQFVKDNIDLSKLTKKELNLITDYILYGKEQDGKSMVDKKEIFIKPKYSSYSRQEPLSLEELMESPTFDESQLIKEKTQYKKIKPFLNREKCKNIPGMEQLWKEIDKIDRIIKLATGEEQPKLNEKVPKLSSKQLYALKHMLIELRREQYLLKDSVYPEIGTKKNIGNYYNNPIDYQLNYPVFPCGLMKEENDIEFIEPFRSKKEFKGFNIEEKILELKAQNKHYFNFLDKNHIYQLCLNYYDIKDQIEKIPDSPLHNLLWTLDFYIEKANLSPQQKLILEDKKKRLLNKEIVRHLEEELGIHHQENYISTIWNKITEQIAAAADLNYDEWLAKDYASAWKKCNCCNKILLKDTRNFVRKSKAADGLTNCCKRCDQKKRKGKNRRVGIWKDN